MIDQAREFLDASFGAGRQAALRAIDDNPVTRAIYDCAVRALAEQQRLTVAWLREIGETGAADDIEHGRHLGSNPRNSTEPAAPFANSDAKSGS